MKRFLILLVSLLVGLVVYSTEDFNALDVDVPCTIKIFKTDGYLVRAFDSQGNPSKTITWEVEDSVLKIKGYSEDENDNTIIIFTPNDQKILIDKSKYDLKEK